MMALVATLGLLAAAGNPEAACSGSKAQTLYEYRSVSPLLVDEPDAETAVTIKADGCVQVHFPQHDAHRGDYDLRLDSAALDRTARQLEASGVARYSASAVRERLQQKAAKPVTGQATEFVYRTVDENIIEFRFAATTAKGAAVAPVRVSTLQTDLLQLPDDPALIGVAAADETFRDLATRARETGSRARR
jgi:hypothetical protein